MKFRWSCIPPSTSTIEISEIELSRLGEREGNFSCQLYRSPDILLLCRLCSSCSARLHPRLVLSVLYLSGMWNIPPLKMRSLSPWMSRLLLRLFNLTLLWAATNSICEALFLGIVFMIAKNYLYPRQCSGFQRPRHRQGQPQICSGLGLGVPKFNTSSAAPEELKSRGVDDTPFQILWP